MAKAASSKKTEQNNNEVATPVAAQEAPQRLFVIGEKALTTLFTQIQELPFKVANPIIQLLQQSFQEVKPDQVTKEEGS